MIGKRTLILLLVAGILICTGFAYMYFHRTSVPVPPPATPEKNDPRYEVIGTSVEGRKIEAYTYGKGATRLLVVGGMHGGYEWNSVLLAYGFMDYFDEYPDTIPQNESITIIPDANPDGVYKVIGKEGRFALADVPSTKFTPGAGRFNAHDVDLNRNFDCNWKSTSTWQSNVVSAGTAAFSEPEAQAIRDFVLAHAPSAAVFLHSQSNAVYASECNNGVLPITISVMSAYAKAAGYPSVEAFDAYPISGDAEGWLASKNIPAITVELSTHETIEWDRNLAGMKALLGYFATAK